MLSIRNLFLLFEKIISSIQYDCSIHPLLGVKPIIIGTMPEKTPHAVLRRRFSEW